MKLLLLFALLAFGEGVASADQGRFSTTLFAKFQVKGCTTCHDFHEKGRWGLAFGSHRERSVEMCVVCHSKSVTGFEHPEEWFAMPGLYTSGMDARQTCEATRSALHAKFKSRILLQKQLEKHLFEDPRVLWAIEGATPQSGVLPGGKRESDLVRGGLDRWKSDVRSWIEGGMACD